ncbi:hypothetical protein ACFJGW_06135 [Burkholderiaceae bacterium UC74_6]
MKPWSIRLQRTGGGSASSDDDTVGISSSYGLVGLDLTFSVKVSPSGFVAGEISKDGHAYHCLITLFMGKKQIEESG